MAKNYALLGKLAVTSIELGDNDEIITSTARRSSRQQAVREKAKRLSAAMSDDDDDSAPMDPVLLATLVAAFCSDSEDDWVNCDKTPFVPIAPAKANLATWSVSKPTPIKK